jgi:hypothetical protein
MLFSLKPKLSILSLSVSGSSAAYEDPYMAWFVVLYVCPLVSGTSPYGGALAGGATKPGADEYGGG